MDNSQHTPGPWFNTSQDDTPMGEVMDQPLDSGVTLFISISSPNAKADARLIAAAPDLLEALVEERRIRLLGQQPDVHWESLRDCRRACYAITDAAIASATGSTHE